MLIPWRISSFPELQHLSETERRALLESVLGRSGLVRAVARASAVGLLLAIPAAVALVEIARLRGARAVVAALFVEAGMVVLVYWCWVVRTRGQLRMYLERLARTESLPMCLNCGYNLQGVPGPVCPECGGQRPARHGRPTGPGAAPRAAHRASGR